MSLTIDNLKTYALSHNIPILDGDALAYIKAYVKENKVSNILEIGAAYGYSAIALSSDVVHVDTFERDIARAHEAVEWISLLDANVTLYIEDALTYEGLTKSYDLIFIDAAKSKYENFFNKFSPLLKKGGTVICDNINFHNLKMDEIKNKGTKGLLKKLNQFKTFLTKHNDFKTTFLNIGDGLSISVKTND